jgi:hypothetical protein
MVKINLQNQKFDIIAVMSQMHKSYASGKDHERLIYTMTPDYYALYQKAYTKSSLENGIKPTISNFFRGIRIKQQIGEEYLTLSYD